MIQVFVFFNTINTTQTSDQYTRYATLKAGPSVRDPDPTANGELPTWMTPCARYRGHPTTTQVGCDSKGPWRSVEMIFAGQYARVFSFYNCQLSLHGSHPYICYLQFVAPTLPIDPNIYIYIYICYTQSVDWDNPRIDLCKPWIRTLHNNPWIG